MTMRRIPLLTCCLPPLRNERGQSLVETGIVITLFITLTIGLIEFGHAWMVGNMITHAARDGARAAAVVPVANRTNGLIAAGTKTNIQTQVMDEIRNVVPTSGANAATLTATITQPTSAGGIPLVQMEVNGSFPAIFRLVGASFTVDRIVTFRDEGR
jgi:Flp pilus assembly protein TadG